MWHSQALLSKCVLSEPSFLLKVKHNLRFTYLLYEESPRLYNAGILETYDPDTYFSFPLLQISRHFHGSIRDSLN